MFAIAAALSLASCQRHRDPANPETSTAEALAPATEAASPTPNDFIQTFMGSCVLDFPDFNRVEAAAKALKWKRVTDPDQLKLIAPTDGGGSWKAWGFKSGKMRSLLSVGQRDVDGETLKFCVLIADPVESEITRNRIVKLLNATEESSSEQAGQRYRTYSVTKDGKPLLLNFIDAVPMGMTSFNASIITRPAH